MPKINFKLSDAQKFDALWALLNPEFNEEGNWTVNYGISAVYDDYALAFNYETGDFCRAYYTKNDETNMVELGEVVKCYVIDVTEQEKQTIAISNKIYFISLFFNIFQQCIISYILILIIIQHEFFRTWNDIFLYKNIFFFT